MAARWTVLGSGSSGNASLLDVHGFGLLIDLGLGPRQLARRMVPSGCSWRNIHAAILTHTHADHWNDRTLAQLLRQRITLYCHREHARMLRTCSAGFTALHAARLVRYYDLVQPITMTAGLRCVPIPLCHDGGPTFGFRFEGVGDLFSPAWSLGYVADLGCWSAGLVESLVDVDVLALEFNHDVALQRASGRPEALIARVLGDEGHLSNEQAAGLLDDVLSNSSRSRLRHIVQLHLSRQCNRPSLAAEAAVAVLTNRELAVPVLTATHDQPSTPIPLDSETTPTDCVTAEPKELTCEAH